jgi:signal transduction histidine kinase
VNRRRRVAVNLTTDVAARLPLPVEREFWRVAREAVMNAERHSRASVVSVLWACNPEGAVLEVSDDGVGLPAGKAAGVSGYGLLGMRERADSVGAQLEITSWPDKGTTVRMRMLAA